MPRIRFLERNEIDTEKWDRSVLGSRHTDIYARSQWLDIMAKRWGGLVQDDYQAVLPIPWNRKFFLSYIYTPRFTSPLPLCGNPANTLPLQAFLEAIPKRFVRWDLDISIPGLTDPTLPSSADTETESHSNARALLSTADNITETNTRWVQRIRTNFLLSLDKPYDELFRAFRPGYRNLVRQAARAGLQVSRSADHRETIRRAAMGKKIPGMKADDYHRFTTLCDTYARDNMVENWTCLKPTGEPCAGMVLLRDAHKLYYLLSWSNDYGRNHAAAHLLMANIIETHATSRLVLDFEGSDHAGIRHFMEGFGPKPTNYLSISMR